MQACSVLHVAHVGVRRVTVVIVHIGLEEVVVVKYFCVAIFFVIFCIRRCSLYTRGEWFSLKEASGPVEGADLPKEHHVGRDETRSCSSFRVEVNRNLHPA